MWQRRRRILVKGRKVKGKNVLSCNSQSFSRFFPVDARVSNYLYWFLQAVMAESVDATDLKSVVLIGRAGSSPALGTKPCKEKSHSQSSLENAIFPI
jgi:hypothetical protein